VACAACLCGGSGVTSRGKRWRHPHLIDVALL